MPTIPKPVALGPVNRIAIFNAIRRDASDDYRSRVPQATQDSIAATAAAIMEYNSTQNEFINAMVNRIGRVLITSKSYTNPLRSFKKGMLRNGETVEEVFVNIARAHVFNAARAEKTVFKREKPDVSAAYHRLNYKNFYKVTVERQQLQTALLSDEGIVNLIGYIVDSLYSGSEVDEFVVMKQLITEAANNGRMYPIHVERPVDEATGKDFVRLVRSHVNKLTFPSSRYNFAGVTTHTARTDQVLIVDTDVDALMDVDVLAAAFNMEKAEFLARRVVIDNFNELTGAVAALVDKDWFMVLDNLIEFDSIRNPEGLYWNYFYHVWKTFSTSPFCNAILFTTDVVGTINTVTVTGPKTVKPNGIYQYAANVDASGIVSKGVVWSLEGAASDATLVDGQGNLQVGYDESASTLTLKATSAISSSTVGELELTVEK